MVVEPTNPCETYAQVKLDHETPRSRGWKVFKKMCVETSTWMMRIHWIYWYTQYFATRIFVHGFMNLSISIWNKTLHLNTPFFSHIRLPECITKPELWHHIHTTQNLTFCVLAGVCTQITTTNPKVNKRTIFLLRNFFWEENFQTHTKNTHT